MTELPNKTKNSNIQKTEKELLESSLKNLLVDKTESVVISIKGSWGIGKSFFWDKFAKKHIIGKSVPCYKYNKKNLKIKYAYVSLFGKTSLEGIKQDIICQISTISKHVSKLKEKFGGTNFAGIDIGSSLSILSKSDFKDVIICFDDFERISKSVDIKDVIGLISELKEQKHCKIIIINNNDQLKQNDELNNVNVFNKEDEVQYVVNRSNNKESFDLFSEKIIDFEFCYCPTIDENFSLIKDQIKYFDKGHIINYLESTNKNDKSFNNFNIRLHKKLIRSLYIFLFMANKNIDDEIKNAVCNYICENVYGNQIKFTSRFDVNIEPLYKYIDSAMEKSFLNEKDGFLKEIIFLQEKQQSGMVYIEIENLYDDYLFDLNYADPEFEKQLFDVLNKYKNTIIYCLGFTKLKFYLDILSKTSSENEDKYRQFFIEVSKKYIDGIANDKDSNNNLNSMELRDNFEEYDEVMSYLDKKIQNQTSTIKSDINKIIEQLNKPKEKGGWSPSDVTFLSSISVKEHMVNMKESKKYLYATFRFAQHSNSYSGSSPFQDTYDNILQAMISVSNENKEYKVKLERLISSLKGPFG